MDLLLPEPSRKGTMRPNTAPEQPKLEIKKDPKGLVTVVGAISVPATSAQQLLGVIEQASFVYCWLQTIYALQVKSAWTCICDVLLPFQSWESCRVKGSLIPEVTGCSGSC